MENSFLSFSTTSWRHTGLQPEFHPFLALGKCERPASCSGSCKGTYHLLERRLGGSQSWSGCSGKEIKLFLSLFIMILGWGRMKKLQSITQTIMPHVGHKPENPRNQDWQNSHILMILHQVILASTRMSNLMDMILVFETVCIH